MTIDTYVQVAFWLALAGTLFAGYIMVHRLILKECPFNEECPYFLGLPACEYGFAMFLAMCAVAGLALLGTLAPVTAKIAILCVSVLGTLFAGYFVVAEIAEWMHSGAKRYGLVFPTCAYGLVFYILLLVLSAVPSI